MCTYIQTHSDIQKCVTALKIGQFWNSALRSEPKQIQSMKCFKKWTWHLLSQIEMKIVKYKPNLCNLFLAFSQRFQPLEGCPVFHIHPSAATHSHTQLNWYALPQCAALYKLLHIITVTRYSRIWFLRALIENPCIFPIIHEKLNEKGSSFSIFSQVKFILHSD